MRLRWLSVKYGLVALVAVACAFAVAAPPPTVDVTGLVLRFGQPVGNVGTIDVSDFASGSIRFTNVVTVGETVVDAVVSVESLIGQVERYRIDKDDNHPLLEHNAQTSGDNFGDFGVEIRIQFFLTGTVTPVTLTGVVFNAYDIDNKQFLRVDGLAAYQRSNNTHVTISASDGSVLFGSPSISTSNDDGTAFTVGRVKVYMPPVDTFTYAFIVDGDDPSGSVDLDFSEGIEWRDTGDGAAAEPTLMSASNPIVPGTPTALVPTLNGANVSVAFVEPFSGGAPIIFEYSIDGGPWTSAGASSPVSVPHGATDPYSIRLRARNSVGAGPPSLPVSVWRDNRTLDATNVGFLFGEPGQLVTPTFALGSSYPAPGTALHYRNVATIAGVPIDAVATFVEGANLGDVEEDDRDGRMRRIDYDPEDEDSNGWLQHSVRTKGGAGWVEVRIDFFVAGTYNWPNPGIPVTLSGLVLHFYDLDRSASLTIGGISGYSLDPQTNVETVDSLDGGKFAFNTNTNSTGDSFTVKRVTVDLAPTSTVLYRLDFNRITTSSRSVNIDLSAGEPWSPTDFPIVVADVPAAPTALIATPGIAAASIAFTPPSDGGSPITHYQYSVDGSEWFSFSPAATGSPVQIPSLLMGATYSVRLRAVNAVGAGPASAPVLVNLTTVPSAPVLNRLQPSDAGMTLIFTPPASTGGTPITNYQYSVNGGDWIAFNPAVTGSPATVVGLVNGNPVTLRLRAVNSVGAGPASNALSATPRPSVEGVRALASDGSVTLLFDPYPGATGMEYQLLSAPSASEVLVPWRATGTNTLEESLHLLGLENGKALCVQLRAVLANSQRGPASVPVCFTPTANPVLPEATPQVVAPQEVQRVKREADGSLLLNFSYRVTNTSGTLLPSIWVRTIELPVGASVVSVVADSGPGELRIFPWYEQHWYWDDVNLEAGATRSLSVTIRVRGEQ